jgi:ribosomal protein L12E/L44/L45/RPP1/RPP2
MVTIKEIQATLNAPGLVTKVPLSFNQLKVEIAKKLHIEVDDAVFNEHKQTIKDSYVKVYQKVCNEAAPAPAPAPAKKSAPAPPKPTARAAPAKKAPKKRQDSESEDEESDASDSGSDSDESNNGGRKGSAFSSDPEVRRLTGIAK